MNLLQDRDFKLKYQKCKYRVKVWEGEFKKKHGLNPTKADIRRAPVKIQESYKQYYHMKTRMLESLDILMCEESDTSFSENSEAKSDPIGGSKLEDFSDKVESQRVALAEIQNCADTSDTNSKKPVVKDDALSAPAPNKNDVWTTHVNKEKVESQRIALAEIQNCSDTSDTASKKPVVKDDSVPAPTSNKNDVWGTHLNKEKIVQKKTNPIQRSYSSAFTEKLAKACMSSTRNPRKSLTRRLKKTNSSVYNTLSQETVSQDFLCETFSSAELSQDSSPLGADSLSCSLPVSASDPVNGADSTLSMSFNSGFQNLKLANETRRVNSQPVSFIHKALTSNASLSRERKVDIGWLERCSQMTSFEDKLSTLSDNAVDISLSSSQIGDEASAEQASKINSSICLDDIGSDEDVIYSSDSESAPVGIGLKRKSSIFSSQSEQASENVCKKRKLNDNENSQYSLVSCQKEVTCISLQLPSSAPVKSCDQDEKDPFEESSNEKVADPNTECKNVLNRKVSSLEELSRVNVEDLADQIIKRNATVSKNTRSASQKLTKKEVLEKKLASGQANENFVRINLKKKVYVRGKKTMTYAKHKKLQWKANKRSASLADDSSRKDVMRCYKCGDVGHFARNCEKGTGDKLMPQSDDEDDCPFPTLEEAAAMASKSYVHARPSTMSSSQTTSSQSVEESQGAGGVKIPSRVLELLRQEEERKAVEPVFDLGRDGTPIQPPPEVYKALREFGHKEFRKGQTEAIMRILSGLSTLVTLSTGSGKSLCYQLPALMYSRQGNCITLVVSPLVSLMEDQVVGLPSCLRAACLHRNQTDAQRSDVMERAKGGELDVLLVSPEAVMAGERSRGFGSIMRDLPPIAFACIDEAHCLSQWSDNFRPSYLMVSEVLRTKLGIKTFLGLTATATVSTCSSIVRHLGIPDGDHGVIKDIPLPNNLVLSVSRDRRRDDALLTLLAGARFAGCDSTIVYCTRRTECERVATLIRTCLHEGRRPEEKKLRCRVSTNAEPYHAGLTAARRRLVQKNFMSGKLRIVVATVAFGMGIDKRNIRGVIHYNMPKNFESYVQEVGRAGRDGLVAHCHLFLDSEGGDLNEIRRHIYANSVERHIIRKFLQRVFVQCRCNRLKKLLETEKESVTESSGDVAASERVQCPGHEVAFKIEETVQALDLPEENISTMLCYLELHPKKWIKVLSPAYTMCKVQSYKGPKALKSAAKQSPPLAMAIALDQRQGISHDKSSKIEFPVIDVASALNWDSAVVKSHLKNLEWINLAGKWRRTGLCVELSELGFRIQAPGMMAAEELDEALDLLYERVGGQERKCLVQLQVAFEAFTSVAYSSCLDCTDSAEDARSDKLKTQIREYFQKNDINIELKLKEELTNEDQVVADVRQLVGCYPETTFTGRAVARIFHGIDSPCFPASIWGRCRFWRAHLNEDFKLICKVATRELLLLR